MTADFDRYVNDYREIINKVSKISGEQYEYFIGLRIGHLRARAGHKISCLREPLILDYGCGTGITEVILKAAFPKARIFGVDSSRESILAAQKLDIPDTTFLVPDSAALEFKDNSFDLAYSNGTFHHMEHESHPAVFREFRRILKKDGDLFIFENNPFNPLMMKAMRDNPFDAGAKVVHPRYLAGSLRDAGFRINAVRYYFFFPRILRPLRRMEKYLHWLPFGAQYFVWASVA